MLPGAERLTSRAMEKETIAQGLLTGNLFAGAQVKLNSFGLMERFPFGAFADDSMERILLGPIAMQRANAFHDTTFSPSDTIVIGDTPRDIACAKAFGARSLAVASGKSLLEELLAAGADCGVASLEDEEAVDFLGLS